MKKKAVFLFCLLFLMGNIAIFRDDNNNEVKGESITQDLEVFNTQMNISLESEASFIGESKWDQSGFSISRAGDVNGDGFDDFLIGAPLSKSELGQTYLIFGKGSGWMKDLNLSNANASFIGENDDDYSGTDVAGAGDVNGDGYDDIIISSWHITQVGDQSGKTYVIFGKQSGWSMKTNLANADASFLAEAAMDRSGYSVAGAGDVNGDAYDDIIISAPLNDEGGNNAGQTYLIFGKATGWSTNTNLANSDASFIGESGVSASGHSASGAGDVNGDEYNDILIGANAKNNYAGETYLIFGKARGWSMDTKLSNADASFKGENAQDKAGDAVAGAGDVNGDGYDDIIIGAPYNNEGGDNAGQTYMIFGKSSGWAMKTSLSEADASFIGEAVDDYSGGIVSGGRDVNGDGFPDILIGVPSNGIGGKTYLISENSTGWKMDINLSKVLTSFIGESAGDGSGGSVSILGDVNGDGVSDILIGARGNDEGGDNAGQTYLITGIGYNEPINVYSVDAYSDGSYSQLINSAEINDEIFIELRGLDGNSSTLDKALVYIRNEVTDRFRLLLYLEETEKNSGIYRNSFKLSTKFDAGNRLFNVTVGNLVNITSHKDQSKYTYIEVVAPIALRSFNDGIIGIEDEEYRVHYWNIGYNEVTRWTLDSDSEWLKFDVESQVLYGTPDNSHVGSCWVRLNITDGLGHYDEHYFNIEVINTPPSILNENIISAVEGEQYLVDYDSDDEGLGHTLWKISPTNIGWLNFNEETGILSGIPSNDDAGTYDINVSINDGNGGRNWTTFKLIAIDINDPPEIMTEPLTSIEQGKNYYAQFDAYDQDDINTFEWTMETEAEFLEIDNKSGIVSGTPANDNVGSYFVNIKVTDLRGLSDWLNYTLEVIDINDPPIWSITPSDTQIDQGKGYTFTTLAIDIDIGDGVSYSISSQPDSDISIDEATGEIVWIGSIEGLTPNPNYVLNVEVSATDGKETITLGFTITVIPNPSPTSTILGPNDGKRITSEGTLLEWEGEDDGEDTLRYDIYLGISQTDVSMLYSSVLWEEDIEWTSIHTGKVEQGKTYFWTVIPKDIYSSGICSNDVFSFSVNIPPSIQEFTIPDAKIGVEFRLNLMGSDLNGDDLEFKLEESPAGMDILEGMIIWAPSESQGGTHNVNVSLSDGYEIVHTEFEVNVVEKDIVDTPDDKGSPIILIIIIIIVILILAGAGVGIFLYLKKEGGEEPSEEKHPEDAGPAEEEKQAYEQFYGPP